MVPSHRPSIRTRATESNKKRFPGPQKAQKQIPGPQKAQKQIPGPQKAQKQIPGPQKAQNKSDFAWPHHGWQRNSCDR